MTAEPSTDPRLRRSAWWPVALAATIFLASSRSQIAGPSIEGSDKVVHFAVYGLLATLTVRLGRGWKAVVLTVLLVSAYGASDEWHQSFTPGRSVEFEDWLADTLGGALAVALYTLWPWYRRLLEISLFRKKQPRVEIGAEVAPVSPP
jgi:VanZ family protein